MHLIIKDIIGPRCITQEDGQRIYKMIYPVLKQDQEVYLDFSGTIAFGTAFFNYAAGQLLRDMEPEHLNKLVKILELAPAGWQVWRRVIENAKEYYKNPEKRKAIDDVIKEQSGEAEFSD